HAFVDPDRAHPALPEDAEDVRERGVVIEVEPQPRGIHEDELALEPDLELLLHLEKVLRRGGEVVQRLLHLVVLDGVEFERAARGRGSRGPPSCQGALLQRAVAPAWPRPWNPPASRTPRRTPSSP